MNTDDARRIAQAEAEQARSLAALPEFPQYGYYVKTGLAGYGADLDSEDMPVTDGWEALADAISSELASAADYAAEGASIYGSTADDTWSAGNQDDAYVDYRRAWQAHELAESLGNLAATFDNKRKDAPLYAGRPELWHATIYRLMGEHFPLDISDNSRLYVWECQGLPGTEDND